MVKLSLPGWDKDKSQPQAGTSFTPKLKSSTSSTSSMFRRLKSPDVASSSQQTIHPLMTLRLSSPSFLDSVIHDGSSDNPLYVIDTDDNITKVRRSDPKGFVNVSRVRWPTELNPKAASRKSKDLSGVEVVFGKGQWKPADEFLGYSYGSLSSYRKFYIPHHQHSLRWKRSGTNYVCTTETVKGPVAVLELALQRIPPQLKIIDPLFRVGTSKPQRMHNGLPLSLLDFLLVTAMLLVTPSDEWMNVTRAGPSESFTDLNHSISTSSGFEGLQPSETRPSSSSLSSETPDPVVLEQNTEATPAIENWRSHIPRNRDDDQSRYAESVNGPASPTASRTTSRTSFHTDTQSTTNHAAHPSVQGMYSVQSSSSLSLASHAFSATQNSNRRTRELPTPPVQSSSHGYTYGRGPSSASSHVSHASYAGYPRPSHDEPPPIPPLPASSSASAPPRTSRPSAPTPIIVPSRHTTASPTFSVHARSLPIPPTPSTSKPPIPSLPPLSMPSTSIASTPSSPIPGPASSVPHVPSLPRSQSFSHLQQRAAQQQHEYHSPVKAPPNYAASAHDPTPLPSVPRPGPGPATNHQPLSIRTTDVGPAPGLPSAADARVGTGAVVLTPDDTEAELYDFPPPAYSAIDMARSPLRLHAVNGDEGMQ